jgi:hypothetical protein
MQWRHAEHALAGQFERTHLDNDGQGFHDEYAAHDGEHNFLAHNHRHGAKCSTKRQRTDITHKDLRRVGVEPEKTKAGDITGDGYAELLAATEDGKLAYYPNNIERDNGIPYNVATPIGHGWNATSHLRLSDISGDGYTDLLAVRTDGTLAYYPNNIERDNGIPYNVGTPVGHGFAVTHLP